MGFLIDILDDRERLRRYFDLWRAAAIAPLSDPGVVVVATLDTGSRPRRVVANDGEGVADADPAVEGQIQ